MIRNAVIGCACGRGRGRTVGTVREEEMEAVSYAKALVGDERYE